MNDIARTSGDISLLSSLLFDYQSILVITWESLQNYLIFVMFFQFNFTSYQIIADESAV